MFEDEPRTEKPRPLEDMSLDDLQERIESLKAEIVRTQAEITKKEAQRKSAEALFGSGSSD